MYIEIGMYRSSALFHKATILYMSIHSLTLQECAFLLSFSLQEKHGLRIVPPPNGRLQLISILV